MDSLFRERHLPHLPGLPQRVRPGPGGERKHCKSARPAAAQTNVCSNGIKSSYFKVVLKLLFSRLSEHISLVKLILLDTNNHSLTKWD